MSSQEHPCPIWGEPPRPSEIGHFGQFYNSPRAGGHFKLEHSGAIELKPNHRLLTKRQRANLSYWIYRHNHPYWLRGKSVEEGEDPPILDEEWVKRYRDHTPLASELLLSYLHILIENNDYVGTTSPQLQPIVEDLRLAAGGCRNARDLKELERHTVEKGWTGSNKPGSEGMSPYAVNLEGRIHLEEQLGQLGQERQGFVARWFDCSMDPMYKEGIAPAIWDAGYEPRLINDGGFTGGVVDEILAEIRKSKFVVADFTSCRKCTACEKCKHIGARGGVYFEAGFALGLGKTVFLTCRKDRTRAVHFDVNHLNRIEWETPEDLREDLKNSIEAVLGHGPRSSSNGDQEVVGSNSSLAA